jgi:hypothetical protein
VRRTIVRQRTIGKIGLPVVVIMAEHPSNLGSNSQRKGWSLDDAGIPAATQHLRDSFNRWVSLELAFYAHHVQPA